LSRQLAEIPFPAPGEPGFHEWANAIRAAMEALNRQRPACLSIGAHGRAAPPAKARRFAVRAVPLATRFRDLGIQIARAGGDRRRQLGLGRVGLRLANGAAAQADLEALGNPRSYARGFNPGPNLNQGRVRQLPGFASDIQRISEYERVMVERAEQKAARDPDFRGQLDLRANLSYGKPYAQLTPQEKTTIASQVQPQSGALDVLLNWVRRAGRSGAGVIFGR